MTKRIALLAAGLMTAAGCVLPPEDVTQEDLALFDAALASIGCDLVGESDYLPVELQSGLPRAKVIEVAQYRVAREEAVMLSNGGVRLVTGACAPDADVQVAEAT
ncbi:hypothetical protein [Cognatishimia sp. F0-27]|uniref:hypothetical protein n=1 Tax=Cognatishimia sp. F0-27 TaxID=2816855 RepID=UPI001D0C3738|nr:hypothetical protein [Cognatishimia sp. F0-27]MCC1492303.1 hypothetical protein [Cognatishimia sp. F0-27]